MSHLLSTSSSGTVRGPGHVGEHGSDGEDLALGVRVRGVDDVEHEVRVRDLLQGGLEGGDELVGQVLHEADGVGDGDVAAVGGAGPAHGRVERGEQRVLHQHAGAREAVEQGRLARRWCSRRSRRSEAGVPALAAHLAGGLHLLDLAPQLGHAGADAAAVELDLGLAGAARADARAGRDPATRLAGHRFAPAAEPRQQVFELREFDLRLALLGLGVLGEDVEDQRGAVDDLDLDDVLERAALARARGRR